MYTFFPLIKTTCNTVMHKIVSRLMFLSISQIEKAGTLQQKARQEG